MYVGFQNDLKSILLPEMCRLRIPFVDRKVTSENRPHGAKKIGRQANALYLYNRVPKLEYGLPMLESQSIRESPSDEI